MSEGRQVEALKNPRYRRTGWTTRGQVEVGLSGVVFFRKADESVTYRSFLRPLRPQLLLFVTICLFFCQVNSCVYVLPLDFITVARVAHENS